MTLVFFYPQFKKLTGAERLVLKLADYTALITGDSMRVALLTHRFAPECLPVLGAGVILEASGRKLAWTGNHYVDAAVEYLWGPMLIPRLRQLKPRAIIFFGPPSVPSMWVVRGLTRLRLMRRVPLLYFCFEPPRFIYSDSSDVTDRLGLLGKVSRPIFALYRLLDRGMVGAADAILSNSLYGSSKIAAAYGRTATVIPHGVDFSSANSSDVVSLRKYLGLVEAPTAVTVNHLHPRKRIDLFIEAIREARKQVPDVSGVVVGDGPERANLEELARDLPVKFVGSVPEATLPAYYALGSVYVHTGREESFGLSVIEALAAGIPVVSVDEGGPRDTVQDGISGKLVPASSKALGDAIAGLLLQPEVASLMGTAGARFVAGNFSWDRGATTLLGTLKDVKKRLRKDVARSTAGSPADG